MRLTIKAFELNERLVSEWVEQLKSGRKDMAASFLEGAQLDQRMLGTSIRFTNVDFRAANLQRSSILGNWSQVRLEGANLQETIFRANLHNADLTGCQIRNTDFSHSVMDGANLVDLSTANGVRLSSTNLENAILRNCDLRGQKLGCLKGADLRGARLTQADLSKADLRDCNLSGARLTRFDVPRVNSSADLTGIKIVD